MRKARLVCASAASACLLFAACRLPNIATDEKQSISIRLDWRIDSSADGSVTCSDVSAKTVDWTFEPSSADATVQRFTYDCVSSGQTEMLPSDTYKVEAQLKRADGVILSQYAPDADLELSSTSNKVDSATFGVP